MQELFKAQRLVYDTPQAQAEKPAASVAEKPESQPPSKEEAVASVQDNASAQRSALRDEVGPATAMPQKAEVVESAQDDGADAQEIAETSTESPAQDTGSTNGGDQATNTPAENAPASENPAAPKKGFMETIGLLVTNLQLIMDKFKSGELKLSDIPSLLDSEKLESIINGAGAATLPPEVQELVSADTHNINLTKVDLNGGNPLEALGITETLTSDNLLAVFMKQSNASSFLPPTADTKQLEVGDMVFIKSDNADAKTAKTAMIIQNADGQLKVRYIQGGSGEVLLSESPDKDKVFGFVRLSAQLRTGVIASRLEQQ